jgi:hypothetical protein
MDSRDFETEENMQRREKHVTGGAEWKISEFSALVIDSYDSRMSLNLN